MNPEHLRILLIFGLLGLVVLRNLRGFVHFLRPGAVHLQILGGEAELGDPAVRLVGRELAGLGFAPVGRVAERRPLARAVEQTIYAHEAKGDFAVVFPVGREAWLYFLSEPRAGSFVATADHRFPSAQGEAYVTGGLPNASPSDVYAAHRRQVERVGAAEPKASLQIGAYVDAARRFLARGPGRHELRRRSMRGFLFASAALVWGAMTLWQILIRG